jgi:hypothetical protein
MLDVTTSLASRVWRPAAFTPVDAAVIDYLISYVHRWSAGVRDLPSLADARASEA